MVQIDLTPEEQHMLVELLENRLSDLRMEIADTESLEFREELKKRKRLLKKVLAALNGDS